MTKPKEEPKGLSLLEKMEEIQGAIGKLTKDKDNPFYKSKYADLNQVLDVLNPELERHNIVLTQPLSYKQNPIDGHLEPIITTILSETTGNKEVNEYPFPFPLTIQDPQKMGSAITYYRRYCLKSLFKMQDEDDDANATVDTGSKQEKKPVKTAKDVNFS